MMKLISLLVVIATLFSAACSDSNIGEPLDKNSEVHPLLIYTLDIDACSIEVATIDFEAAMINNKKFEEPFDLTSFFDSINLPETTMKKVNKILAGYDKEFNSYVIKIIESESAVIRKGNRERNDYVRKYRDGLISESDVKEAVNKVNKSIRENLSNNSNYDSVLKKIFKSRKVFIDNVGALLSDNNLTKWYDFTLEHSDVFYGTPY